MSDNLGKKFEQRFKEDFGKIPGTSIDRIYDVTSGYFGLRNICDFIAYYYPYIFYMECKSINGNTFPLSNLKQYDKLLGKKDIKGVKAGVVLWFKDHDKILYIPIQTFEKLKQDDKKSFNIKYLETKEYKAIEIPTTKKKTFLVGDYTVLLNMED